MARLLSVNVGLPRDIQWHGKTVRTAIWKEPVQGRCRVERLNVVGDRQGDTHAHGGEQRAVFVYQIESYRYWQQRLGHGDWPYGQFGENFTVEGLPDAEVCIGDRYRIGTALFEVTQPRTTCYRVGIRMDEPQMAALLTSSGRPGFYFRVLEEGEVGADDPILRIARGPEGMTVAEINALLYFSRHPRDQLERAVRIPAMSPGWRRSFDVLIQSQKAHPGATGNAGLVPARVAQTAAPGFRPLRVAQVVRECTDITSLLLQPTDGRPLTAPVPGQFVVFRLRPKSEGGAFFRSYSLSGPGSLEQFRVTVKAEPNGAAGHYLNYGVRAGDILEVSDPRGSFVLQSGTRSVVLLSAGIGATPVLAMLYALAAGPTDRPVWWLQAARDGESHPFIAEVGELLGALTHAHRQVWYSRPGAKDQLGREYDALGRMNAQALAPLGVPRDSDFYLCGPPGFLTDLTAGLVAWGVPQARIHSEFFSGGPSLTPGLVNQELRTPHLPLGMPGVGPQVSFARSGISVRWRDGDQSLLELAEACDVPVRWACRSGICHNCESGLISGSVSYQPDPLDPPSDGNILICCARPQADVVIDI